MRRVQKYLPALLGDHVSEIATRNRDHSGYQVYSVTNSDGFVPSDEYFKKQVFSKNTANYKIVPPGAFAYNPSRINVGSVDYLRRENPVLVSPLYVVFRTSDMLHAPYLKRFLLSKAGLAQIAHLTQGAVRDSLKFSRLKKIEIPLPPLEDQKRIAAVLDKADALRRQRQESLQLTEELLQSVFLNMFGDPIVNSKGWPMRELGRFGIVQTGNTPSRINKENYSSEGLEWIKADNILEDSVIVTPAAEKLSEMGAKAARFAQANSLLVVCIAGSEKSIGRVALTDRKVAFNQQINAITPHAEVSPLFLYFLMKIARRQVQLAADKGMKKMVKKSTLESLRFIAPDEEQQRAFEKLAQRLIAQTRDCHEQLAVLEALFISLQQRAFRGEMDLRRFVLDPSADTPAFFPPAKVVTKQGKPKAATRFLQAPTNLKPSLRKLDLAVIKGDPIPWSEDYFKYHILATQPVPFSFTSLMQKAEAVFEEPPPYDTIRELIFDLLGQDGKPVILRQRFDLQTNLETSEVSGRKEILFELVP